MINMAALDKKKLSMNALGNFSLFEFPLFEAFS